MYVYRYNPLNETRDLILPRYPEDVQETMNNDGTYISDSGNNAPSLIYSRARVENSRPHPSDWRRLTWNL